MPGSYCIDFKTGDRLISRAYFNVREYVKPAYRIDIGLDREQIFGWESARLSVDAGFYEGTPVSNLKLTYRYYGTGADGDGEGFLNCDRSGHAELVYRPSIQTDEWYPVAVYFNIHNAEAEDEEIYASKTLTVFPKDVMIKIKTHASKDKTRGYATFYANRIHILARALYQILHAAFKDSPHTDDGDGQNKRG
ncbi:MAG: alpha-2-macroglobulin [Tepidanaerobacteraceae bacterium]|nr:alpha-2-macroglobulin [Tepidanaerobacteraceae bacterium]